MDDKDPFYSACLIIPTSYQVLAPRRPKLTMSNMNSNHDNGQDDCAHLFDLIAPSSFFPTTDLAPPTFHNTTTTELQSTLPFQFAVPQLGSSLQASPSVQFDQEKLTPASGKRKHSDVEKDRRRSISNGFAVSFAFLLSLARPETSSVGRLTRSKTIRKQMLQNVLDNDSNAKPISKSVLLQQACNEILELRKKLDASTTIISRFRLENLFRPNSASPPSIRASRPYSSKTSSSGGETPRDSPRTFTSTTTTGTPKSVSDHHRGEKRGSERRRQFEYATSSDSSSSRSSSDCDNPSESEQTSSESEGESEAETPTTGERRSKRPKRVATAQKKSRTHSKTLDKRSSSSSPSTTTSFPSETSSQHASKQDLQQAILSLLLELPTHLKQMRSIPQTNAHHDNTERQAGTKTRSQKQRRLRKE